MKRINLHNIYFIVIVLVSFFVGCDQSALIRDDTTSATHQPLNDSELNKVDDHFVEKASGRYMVVFESEAKGDITKEAADEAVRTTQEIFSDFEIATDALILQYKYVGKGFAAMLTDEQVDKLRNDPRIARVVQDYYFKGRSFTESVIPEEKDKDIANTGWGCSSTQATPWGILRVNGPMDGYGKKAWILDTGIDLTHPDLFVDVSNSTNIVFSNLSPNDYDGHGTHVAGIIAARNNSIGVVGVAAGAQVVAVKVLDDNGFGFISEVRAGVDYVSNLANTDDVINLSLGFPLNSPAINEPAELLENSIIAAANNGLRFTLSAGNESMDANLRSPSRINHNNVWVVSAMNINNQFASFSNYGNPPINYAAPGVNINSLWKNGGTNTVDGTSQAAPHIAGVLLATGSAPLTNGTVSGDPSLPADPIGVAPSAPNVPTVNQSVQSGHPHFTWNSVAGADSYEIQILDPTGGGSGDWCFRTSTTIPSFTDTQFNGASILSTPYGDWIAYRVRSVNQYGKGSPWTLEMYYSYDPD